MCVCRTLNKCLNTCQRKAKLCSENLPNDVTFWLRYMSGFVQIHTKSGRKILGCCFVPCVSVPILHVCGCWILKFGYVNPRNVHSLALLDRFFFFSIFGWRKKGSGERPIRHPNIKKKKKRSSNARLEMYTSFNFLLGF